MTVADTPEIEAARAPGPKRRLKSLASLDRRTAAAKAAYALRDQIIADLGGDDAMSAMKRMLVDKVAILETALNDLAAGYLAGEPCDMGRFATMAKAQRQLLADLGLERKCLEAKTLSDYIASKGPEIDVEDADSEDLSEPDPAP